MGPEQLAALFWPDWSEVRRACRIYSLQCVAHRLRKFGFEPQINCYSGREMAMLAMFMPLRQRDIMMAEAFIKDPNLKKFTEAPCP